MTQGDRAPSSATGSQRLSHVAEDGSARLSHVAEDGSQRLSHVAEDGSARMVDVSEKQPSARFATATGCVRLSPKAAGAVREQALPKGDVLTIARIAGIQAAKRTWELIPLCHPIGLTGIEVDVELVGDVVQVAATTRTHDRTGVEMEALTAVAVAGLTIIDMVKAIDQTATISEVSVAVKGGGVHGEWRREPGQ